MENNIKILKEVWCSLYGDNQTDLLEDIIEKLYKNSKKFSNEEDLFWYKNAVVYSLYVDKFNRNFSGILSKLDYLKDLGVNCLWLLPILESPLKDGGFDVSDYYKIRSSLLDNSDFILHSESSGALLNNKSDLLNNTNEPFRDNTDTLRDNCQSSYERNDSLEDVVTFEYFLSILHQNNIKVIFDLPLNHCSSKHRWFLEAKQSKKSKYREFFIWSKDTTLYKESGILFSGLSKSNWTKADKQDDEYYFHRFFDFQPDLNYKNPKVLIEMTNIIIYWLNKGIDGFRLDAIPFIWKEEKTDCRNLTQTHLIVKFLRAAANIVNNNVLMLAEACQPLEEIVKYLNDNSECNGAYNFPLITSIYKSLATENKIHIENILIDDVFKKVDQNAQWFLFLRGHDELSFEKDYVSEKDRENLVKYYCKDKRWSFRNNEGISSRLSELFNFELKKILLANSLLLTLPCTPIIYYGDELALGNDYSYFDKFKLGNNRVDDSDDVDNEVIDSRNIIRGSIDWDIINTDLRTKSSLTFQVFNMLKKMIHERNLYKVFGEGKLIIVETNLDNVLAYKRVLGDREVLVLNNLSDSVVHINIKNVVNVMLDSYDFKWLEFL
jgi:maltose alpha-D-glucosyltransferase/alpha-amylase